MQKLKFTLLHHKERSWADYFVEYTELSELVAQNQAEVEIGSLPQQNSHLAFARLPERVRRLLFFAKPDLVVCMDDGQKPITPIFAIDATEHVAARDHWIQRFPNLVGCAQEGVPGAFVAPRDMPNRAQFVGRTDPVFFFAYDRVIEIHQTPIYIAEWPSSDGAQLDADSKYADLPPHDSVPIRKTLEFFHRVLDSAMKGRELSSLMRERIIVELRNELRSVGYKKIPIISDFERLKTHMPDGVPLTNAKLGDWLSALHLALPQELPDRIKKRDRNLIFSPLVKSQKNSLAKQREILKKRIKLKGGDPYTQQPLVFDYLFCRLGPSALERDVNVIIDLSVLQFSDFAEYVVETWKSSPLQHKNFAKISDKIPIYTLHLGEGLGQVMKNFVRIYAFAADMIVFRDGLIYF